MPKFKCTKKCYARGRIWNPGDNADEKICGLFRTRGSGKGGAR